MEDPEFRKKYDALAPEFDMAQIPASMRKQGQLTREQTVERPYTTQSDAIRLESGGSDAAHRAR